MADAQHPKEDELMRRAESALGKVLRDKWKLDSVLGIGGMAAVYSATHRNGKRAAVKVLHPEAALAPTVKDRFLREGYLANKVEHPGAVSILDDDVDVDGTVFLVMELLRGETLDARLARSGSRISATELLQIVDPILDCLAFAHEKGIVHRDLKPGNLFITDGGAVKILDFGIARLEEIGQIRPGGTGAQTLGTPGFMPPEQARGRWEEVDAQSDLWAVGAVMFAAMTGKHVHEAPTVNEQLLAAMTVPAEPLQRVVKEAPEALATVVDRALAFAKPDRWPSARAMREAVRAAYEAIEGKPLAQAPRLSVRPPSMPSVGHNAATLDASAEALARVTTARPVIDSARSRAGSSRKILLFGIAALVGGAGLLLATRHSDAERPPVPAGVKVTLPAEAPRAAPSPPPAPAAEPPPNASAAGTQSPAAGASGRLPDARKVTPPRSVTRPLPAASAPAKREGEGESVDIFTKRR